MTQSKRRSFSDWLNNVALQFFPLIVAGLVEALFLLAVIVWLLMLSD